MSRLIDADKLIEEMSKWYWDKEKQKASEEDVSPMDLFTHLAIKTVQEQPTAFDVNAAIDDIVDKLQEVKIKYSNLAIMINDFSETKKYIGMVQAIALAIEIVKGGEAE